MAIFKRCPNCKQLYQGRYCKECATRQSKRRQSQNEALKLYGSGTWRRCRAVIRAKYLDYDIWLLGAGELRRCDKVYVHHIAERDERPDLLYDLDNLITVSADSHAEIHELYAKDKQAALARIEAGKRRFRQMFET